MLELTALHALLLDSLEEQIAVIDREGVIVYVNRAWTNFGLENGLASASSGTGNNYLAVCNISGSSGDSLAGEAAAGIRDVLAGKRVSFHFEYPCHSPAEKRWFMMRAAPLQGDAGNLFVISHHNITQRKLAEERIEFLSLHDPLTGLANRRHFNQFLNNAWRRSSRSRSLLSFVMFDLDHFKDYNDELGHLAGDECLIKVGQVLRAAAGRPGDLAVRYGGEEFGLLLEGTCLEDAAKIADAIRQNVHELDMRYRKTRLITVSAGVASVIPEGEQSEIFLIREADKALYRAKQQGRNRVVCAGTS
ncbi:sensor domain-containing diguanylate cyclase [Sideroxydans lithotrophicus]|uniref:diguanylate cyclase n=1 Tax=Sideroxydans lithotrophicus (strain ES-1) TaxID=580332 RepID=D5CSR9_SIDLE|nr:sensor domain-containing diguanylate cyclase [Sideroxydans lithotrophicus]ADE12005.1 diguanylate cyclase [Sideroxydans lithotrophicus ES-1]